MIEIGKTIDQIHIGDQAIHFKTITEKDLDMFGEITNDFNPAHFDEGYASKTMFKKRIAHGMLVGSLFSKLLGMDLPGKGTIYLSQTLRFRRPVYLEDSIKAEVIVKDIDIEKNRVTFDCICTNQDNERVVIGEAVVIPPVKEK